MWNRCGLISSIAQGTGFFFVRCLDEPIGIAHRNIGNDLWSDHFATALVNFTKR